jgi:hypothetical protein
MNSMRSRLGKWGAYVVLAFGAMVLSPPTQMLCKMAMRDCSHCCPNCVSLAAPAENPQIQGIQDCCSWVQRPNTAALAASSKNTLSKVDFPLVVALVLPEAGLPAWEQAFLPLSPGDGGKHLSNPLFLLKSSLLL